MLYVVTGPPCVGKSTWVRDRAQIGDVVVDLDRIALAITAEQTPHHEYGPHIRKLAIAARRVIVEGALAHSRRGTSYIIHAKPSERARAKYHRAQAVYIELEAPWETLKKRALEERPEHIWKTLAHWWDESEE